MVRTSPTTFAGQPATTANSGTSLVTTAPAAMSAPSPIVIPHTIVAPEPMEAWRFTVREFERPVGFRLRRTIGVRGARKAVIGEHDAVTDEALVLDRDAFADEGVRGDLAALADERALLDLDESADARTVADFAAVKVHEVRVEDVYLPLAAVTLSEIGIGSAPRVRLRLWSARKGPGLAGLT